MYRLQEFVHFVNHSKLAYPFTVLPPQFGSSLEITSSYSSTANAPSCLYCLPAGCSSYGSTVLLNNTISYIITWLWINRLKYNTKIACIVSY